MKFDDLKDIVPVRLQNFEEKDGIVTILFKNEKKSLIDKLFFKKISEKPYKVDLDEIGSFIWKAIDGICTVQDIAGKAGEFFGEKINPLEERISAFFLDLSRNKFIQLYQKDKFGL